MTDFRCQKMNWWPDWWSHYNKHRACGVARFVNYDLKFARNALFSPAQSNSLSVPPHSYENIFFFKIQIKYITWLIFLMKHFGLKVHKKIKPYIFTSESGQDCCDNKTLKSWHNFFSFSVLKYTWENFRILRNQKPCTKYHLPSPSPNSK